MQIAIESTDRIVEIDGVSCRVWNGVTAAGVDCEVYIHRLRVLSIDDCSEFDAALREMPVPLTFEMGPETRQLGKEL